MTNNLKEFKDKFKVKKMMIYESDYWIWSLRPEQVTIGAGILSLKREVFSLSNLKEEEFKNLYDIIPIIEDSLSKTFDYDIMNYLMLMMVDNQVHYHIIPRYKKEIKYLDRTWVDLGWPKAPNLKKEVQSEDTLYDILNEIKKNVTKI